MANITNIKIGEESPKAIVFDTYSTQLSNKDILLNTIIPKNNNDMSESPEGTWEINDGWDIEFVNNGRQIRINKFKIDTWGLRHKVLSSSANANKYRNMSVKISGVSYVNDNIIKSNPDSDEVTGFINAYTGNNGYTVEWYPGQFISGNYVKGLVIQGQPVYTDSWNNARDLSYAMGKAPWEINATRDRFVTDGVRPIGMMTGGGCNGFAICIFGGCQTAASKYDESNGAYREYDISDHPIIIDLDVADYSAPIDASSVECWDTYCGDTQIYHKDKTVENCWVKYGMARIKTNKLGVEYYSMDMANIPSLINNPILPSIVDLEEHLIPTKSSGIKQVTFNHAFKNDELANQIKEYYATHPLINVDDDYPNKSIYKEDDNTPLANKVIQNAQLKGDIKFIFDGNNPYYYVADMFRGNNFDKITLQFNHTMQMSSPDSLFKSCNFKDVEVIKEDGTPHLLGANDCHALCEYANVPSIFPGIINWTNNYTSEETSISWIFSNSIGLVELASTGNRGGVYDVITINNCSQAFENCKLLKKIGPILSIKRMNIGKINGDSTKPAYRMFYNCNSLTDVRIKGLNGSYVNFASNIEVGNIPNLDAESIKYLFDNLTDLTTYDESIASPTINNYWEDWSIDTSLADIGIIFNVIFAKKDSETPFVSTFQEVDTTIVVNGLLDGDTLIWKTSDSEITLQEGENTISGIGGFILRRGDKTDKISLRFLKAYYPGNAKSPSAELHVPSKWIEHLEIPAYNFDNMTDNGALSKTSYEITINKRNALSNSSAVLYTNNGATIKIKVEGLVNGDVLGVGGGNYDFIQNKITEDGIYEFTFTSTWGFKLWNEDTTINSVIKITSLDSGDVVASKITNQMLIDAAAKNWSVYCDEELVSSIN